MPINTLIHYLQLALRRYFVPPILRETSVSFSFITYFQKKQRSNRTKNSTPETEKETSQGKCLLKPLMAYLWQAFLQFFCSINFTLTFSFLFFGAYFQTINASTEKKRTPVTEIAISEGKCRLNNLMEYLRWAFPALFCSVHYLLTFIFIFVWSLLFSF